MFMAIAVESARHPLNRGDYKVWYLEIDTAGNVVGIGVMKREEMVQNLFNNYQKTGKSNWRAFTKGAEESTPIEVYDFISQNMHENTHFGNLPTLAEFQATLNRLETSLELRAIAS
jgi:hypothetical protein